MTIFSRTLIVLALASSGSAVATPSFDSLTIRSTEINAPTTQPLTTITVDPTTGTRTDTQYSESDIRGWELNYSEQTSDNTYWFATYRNDRFSQAEYSQIYQQSPITISTYPNETKVTTSRYSLGAGYIMHLSEKTTADFSGSIGRMKFKVSDYFRYTTEQT